MKMASFPLYTEKKMSIETVVPARVRSQRLSAGKCPEHGEILSASGDLLEQGANVGTIYKCGNPECTYNVEARFGTRMDKLLRR